MDFHEGSYIYGNTTVIITAGLGATNVITADCYQEVTIMQPISNSVIS